MGAVLAAKKGQKLVDDFFTPQSKDVRVGSDGQAFSVKHGGAVNFAPGAADVGTPESIAGAASSAADGVQAQSLSIAKAKAAAAAAAPAAAEPTSQGPANTDAGASITPLNQGGKRRNRFFAKRGRSSIQVDKPAGAGLSIRSGISVGQ